MLKCTESSVVRPSCQFKQELNVRYCIGCEHFEISFGTPDFSDVTPGEPSSITCYVNVFKPVYGDACRTLDVERLMRTAQTCAQYKERT